MTTSCTNRDHPYYSVISKLDYRNVPNFFKVGNGRRMKFVTLGELLDFSSVGQANFCYWDMDSKGLTRYVQDWMEVQNPEDSFEWNNPSSSSFPGLPYVNHSSCPKCSFHVGQIKDRGGKIRCAHVRKEMMRPSFIRGSQKDGFFEENPFDTDFLSKDLKWLGSLEAARNLWCEEKSTEKITNRCYSIISDVGAYLPLETIFWRLSVGKFSEGIAFPFSGFDLADYVAAWENQEGKRRLFRSSQDLDDYRKFSNFQILTSDD